VTEAGPTYFDDQKDIGVVILPDANDIDIDDAGIHEEARGAGGSECEKNA
jgi:hypothetical protein